MNGKFQFQFLFISQIRNMIFLPLVCVLLLFEITCGATASSKCTTTITSSSLYDGRDDNVETRNCYSVVCHNCEYEYFYEKRAMRFKLVKTENPGEYVVSFKNTQAIKL